MIRTKLWRFVALVALLAVVAMPAQQANAATVYWPDGMNTIYPTHWEYFETVRTVSESPYGIAFHKIDGPSMGIRWHGYCPGASGGQGPVATVSNDDPAPWVWLKANGSAPTYLRFCVAMISYGSLDEDSFEGYLDWDGTS